MSSESIPHVAQFFSPGQSGRRTRSSQPIIEALESRSLLDATTFVRGLYANVLQRSPADLEVAGWVNQIESGTSMKVVAATFLGSTERLALVVNIDYATLLGRSADQASSDSWVQQLSNGMTQNQLTAAILGSQEYLNLHGGTDTGFVQGVYKDKLFRSTDSEGLAFWNNQLANGASRAEVSLSILGTQEAHRRSVDMIYQVVFHRDADTDGCNYWASFLDKGSTEADVMGAMILSYEYMHAYGVAPS